MKPTADINIKLLSLVFMPLLYEAMNPQGLFPLVPACGVLCRAMCSTESIPL